VAARFHNGESKKMSHEGLIGAKLRTLRQSQGLTLKELAARTATSIGHLSQLERDMASPSVRTLYVISRALGVTISRFFDNGEDSAEENPYVVRKSQRRHIRFAEGIDDFRLTSEAVGKIDLLYSTFQPGAFITEFYSHEGEEAGYVISGRLELQIDNFKTILGAGDSFSFPSQVPHKYRNPGDAETAVIWAMTPPTY
jgi:transcriptional regulator with XRE-family HTH domain